MTDRRGAIADEALVVLAEEGAKGLTHRALDGRLGLPAGSTSYYFRTRSALFEVAEARLFDLDAADVARTEPGVESVARLVDLWLAPRNRVRLVARFELFLAEARRRDKGPILTSRAQFVELIEAGLLAAGVADPRLATIALLATVEGLLVGGLIGPPISAADRAAVVASALEHALGR